MEHVQLRLMTYNVGGSHKASEPNIGKIIQLVQEHEPDILTLQEAREWLDAEGKPHSVGDSIARALGYTGMYFGPTLSMQEHMHIGQSIFIYNIFHDYLDWRKGNAVLTRQGFVRLGNPASAGEPRNIPLFRPVQYQGNRDTDPRHIVLARIKAGAVSPFIVAIHLSTLVGERGGDQGEIPGKVEEAREMRCEQVRRLLALLKEYVLEPGELVFLMGDFNATVNEACIASLLKNAGFVYLTPQNEHTATHPKVSEPIDHIFVYPASRLVGYTCHIIETTKAYQASDHLPVVAEVSVV
jgi:endonuclease/exonuclease/phosphatase family metal-dependent hydrolase